MMIMMMIIMIDIVYWYVCSNRCILTMPYTAGRGWGIFSVWGINQVRLYPWYILYVLYETLSAFWWRYRGCFWSIKICTIWQPSAVIIVFFICKVCFISFKVWHSSSSNLMLVLLYTLRNVSFYCVKVMQRVVINVNLYAKYECFTGLSTQFTHMIL